MSACRPKIELQENVETCRHKIELQETVEAVEIDEEKQTKLKGRTIVSGMRFRVAFIKVNFMENVLSRNGLGSSWIIRYYNESCPSQNTNSATVGGNLYLFHVALQLLYRKLIPLRFLPWCNNLITLGCRRILVILCFLKVKNRQVARAFRVPSRQPLDQID